MKKIFTLAFFAFAAIVGRAAEYTEPIVVIVNGEAYEQSVTINVEQNGDTYDLTLRNFVLDSPDGPMGVGNVAITNVAPTTIGDAVILKTSQRVTITPGDDPSVLFWMADMLPPVPVNMICKLENNHLRCNIDIDLQALLQQVISVTVGKGYQLLNTGFENWHKSVGDYEEPNGWHSFETATGMLASMAGHHITKSDVAHSGKASARIFATSIFGIVANGTMTTGRLNAGSMSAIDVANHAFLDMSSADVDGNGDPFYTPLFSRPDSVVAWVQFKQGTPNADNPYATVSAVITDGTFYQDPEDKAYTNVVAKAKYNTIAQTDGAWIRVVAPFEYTENAVEPKAILMTLSTNANPGQGSGDDELLIDDVQLIYNAGLTSLKVKGQDVPAFATDKLNYEMEVEGTVTLDDIVAVADGKAALIDKKMEMKDDVMECQIVVYSGDMGKATTYTILIKQHTTGISNIDRNEVGNHAIYNLNGQRVMKAQKGIYIINGKKVLQ